MAANLRRDARYEPASRQLSRNSPVVNGVTNGVASTALRLRTAAPCAGTGSQLQCEVLLSLQPAIARQRHHEQQRISSDYNECSSLGRDGCKCAAFSRCARAVSRAECHPPSGDPRQRVSGRIRPKTDLCDTCQDPSGEPTSGRQPLTRSAKFVRAASASASSRRKTKVAPRYGLRITPSR